MFAVRQVCGGYLAKRKDVFWAFICLEKGCDRIDSETLRGVRCLYGVGKTLLKAVMSFYVGSRACVSAWFPVIVERDGESFMTP